MMNITYDECVANGVTRDNTLDAITYHNACVINGKRVDTVRVCAVAVAMSIKVRIDNRGLIIVEA